MSSLKIGILGRGLIGGSIAKKLGDAIILSHWNEKPVDVLILAVPISAILAIGAEIAKASPRLIVIDVGSVKGEICRKFEEWTTGMMEFVATHPMAGKAQSGFEASEPELFKDAPWVITPHAKNQEETLRAVEDLIAKLGARSLIMDADTHDRRASLVSHLPFLLSKALLEFVEKADPEALEMAGPGFRSMTRLAKDNPEMRQEIYKHNQEQIDRHLADFLKGFS